MPKFIVAKTGDPGEVHCADIGTGQPRPDLLDPSHGEIP
jgi:hypothetical protein